MVKERAEPMTGSRVTSETQFYSKRLCFTVGFCLRTHRLGTEYELAGLLLEIHTCEATDLGQMVGALEGVGVEAEDVWAIDCLVSGGFQRRAQLMEDT
jgi:hypothetical protein